MVEPDRADVLDGAPRDDWDRLLAWAVDAGRFGVALLDGDGRVRYANRPARELLAAGSEMNGRPLGELVHPDDRGWVTSELGLLLAGELDRVRHEVRLATAGSVSGYSELNIRRIVDTSDRSVRAVALIEDASDRQLRERELRRLAETDPLSDLPNRRRFSADLDQHLAWAARYGARGALLVLDIDQLKQINDTFGHAAGDHAIVTAANLIRSHTRASDTIARLGGDEFAILLPNADHRQATDAAAALTDAIARHQADALAPITVSIGIAIVSDDGDAAALLSRADRAMYQAKRTGGNGYRCEHDHSDAPVITLRETS